MLLSLHIKNYALIDDLRIEFGPGLNIFTGETGAGKSIIIESLGLILGERSSSQTVKKGATRCSITAEFDTSGLKELNRFLKNSSLDVPKDENLIIRRDVDLESKSRAYVNDTPVSISALQAIGEYLVDIHGQHEHQSLIKSPAQRLLLDTFGGHEELKEKIAAKYRAYKDLLAKLESQNMSEAEKQKLIDLYSFQVNEIDEAGLNPGEEEELESSLPQLKNSEKLRELAEEAHSLLYSGEETALEKLSKTRKLVEDINSICGALKDTSDNLSSAYYQMEEASSDLKNFLDGLNADPEQLNNMMQRQDLISKLKKKYGADITAISAYREKTNAELNILLKSGESKKELQKQLDAEKKSLDKLCAELSEKRKKAGAKLSAGIQKELADLGMKKIVFAINVEPLPEPGEDGADKVDFVFSPNAGQDLKPIKDIASGGEMSRVMLAVKTVLAKSDMIPVLVFDEIDAGVGGPTAQSVGTKLKTLSKSHQVLCITHLPQIAAFRDTHMSVSKVEKNKQTATIVTSLSDKASVEEIARMLSGKEVSQTAVKHAEELVQQSR